MLGFDLAMPHHEERTRLRDQVDDVRGMKRKLPKRPENQGQILALVVLLLRLHEGRSRVPIVKVNVLPVQVDLHLPCSVRDRQIRTGQRLELHQRMISSQPVMAIPKGTLRGVSPCVENTIRDAALSQPLLVFISKVGAGIEALGKSAFSIRGATSTVMELDALASCMKRRAASLCSFCVWPPLASAAN